MNFLQDCLLGDMICTPGIGCVETHDQSDGGVPDPPPDGGAPGTDPGTPPDVEADCSPGDQACVGTMVYFCGSDESWTVVTDCSTHGQTCRDGRCVGCTPGTRDCRGESVVICRDDGTDYDVEQVCSPGTVCVEGNCLSQCEVVDDKISYQGCEYWAVDMNNAAHPHPHFAVAISNVSEEIPANIKIYKAEELDSGQIREEVVAQGEVEPQQLRVFDLPARAIIGSRLGYLAYRIETDYPVIAYQFNPLNNSDDTFSNDASLLIPTSALDKEYVAVSGDALQGQSASGMAQNWGGLITVVGVTSNSTIVRVTMPPGISFNTPQGAQVEGQVITARVDRYRVLNIESRASQGTTEGIGNITGARIVAEAPVAVFSGNVATIVPSGSAGQCCADHMEAQLMPVSTWGNTYLAGHSFQRRLPNRGAPIADSWVIVASEDDTLLTYAPQAPSGAVSRLNAGQSVVFRSAQDFIVSGTKPISVYQFLPSSYQAAPINYLDDLHACSSPGVDDEYCTQTAGYLANCTYFPPSGGHPGASYCTPLGDPTMIPIPPMEQFRQDYLFLTPLDYQMDFITVVAPVGASVQLDGNELSGSWQPIGQHEGVSWQRLAVQVPAGAHRLISNQPVGLTVYGLDRDVSYGYVGGLDLERINIR